MAGLGKGLGAMAFAVRGGAVVFLGGCLWVGAGPAELGGISSPYVSLKYLSAMRGVHSYQTAGSLRDYG